jgi:lipoyl(octanoyl) transferase
LQARGRRDAPGVYVGGAKLGSIGLRIRRGCSYHGLALNVAMNLEPFRRINPCGYAGLEVIDLHSLGVTADIYSVANLLAPCLLEALRLRGDVEWTDGPAIA